MSSPENLYKILGVNRSASPEEIKKAYRTLALKFHPDKTGDDNSQKFQQISTAYEILSNPEKRSYYDQTGSINNIDGLKQYSSNIFANFFSNIFVSTKPDKIIQVTYQELIEGSVRNISFTDNFYLDRTGKPVKLTPCNVCQGGMLSMLGFLCQECDGSGRCLPPGSTKKTQTTNIKIRIPEKSWPGRILKVNEKKIQLSPIMNDQFYHSYSNLHFVCPIDVFSALLGKEQIIEVVGKTYKVQHTGPVFPNTQVIVPNAGLYDQSGIKGDLIVIFDVKFPKKLTRHQKIFLEKCL